MAELQQNYEEMVSEKSRLENLWLAAQESEEKLKDELLRILEEVKFLEKELFDREQIILHQKALLEGGAVDETKHQDTEGEIPDPSVEIDNEINRKFAASRSLIAGKVSTSILEVIHL